MSITVDINGTVASIILLGGIDYSKQEEFKKANEKALAVEGVTEIHVNFAETKFLDSSGIRTLLILKKEADKSGRSLILLNCSEKMYRVFEISGFNQMFTFR